MHLLDRRIFGGAILLLLGILVGVKRFATGSIFDKPKGNFLNQLVNTGLAFISPVCWLHFPAILKGWFERVFAYGDAYALTSEGWRGEVKGRVPLLHYDKALVISTAHFNEKDYKSDWEAPMTRMIDDWGLRYPGVKKFEHAYFYRVR